MLVHDQSQFILFSRLKALSRVHTTANDLYVSVEGLVHYLSQVSHVLRCILPFRLDVQQVSVRRLFGASAGGRRYVAPKQDGSTIAALQDQSDIVESLCGSRTDINKANQDGVTPLRTVVLQRLEEMMTTCNHLDIAGGVAGKSSYNIVAGSVDVQVLPEELGEKVAKLHLHLCPVAGDLSFEMSCSFRYQVLAQVYLFPKRARCDVDVVSKNSSRGDLTPRGPSGGSGRNMAWNFTKVTSACVHDGSLCRQTLRSSVLRCHHVRVFAFTVVFWFVEARNTSSWPLSGRR